MFKKLAYNAEQVKAALKAYNTIGSFRKASRATGIPKSTIHRWSIRIGRMLTMSNVGKKYNRRKSRLNDCSDILKEVIIHNPINTLTSLKNELAYRNIQISLTTIHRYIRLIGFSYHDISWRKPPRDVSCEKDAFWKQFKIFLDEGRDIVSIDEVGFMTSDLPARGYGPRGRRLYVTKRHPKRFKASTVMAIKRSGAFTSHTEAGNINGIIFRGFMKELLSHTPTGTVLLLDNISFHKSSEVSRVADEAGANILFTPPYSPECNPVENFFSVLKTASRREAASRVFQSQQEFVDMVRHVITAAGNRQRFEKYFRGCAATDVRNIDI